MVLVIDMLTYGNTVGHYFSDPETFVACPEFTLLSIQANSTKSSFGSVDSATLGIKALCVESFIVESYFLALHRVGDAVDWYASDEATGMKLLYPDKADTKVHVMEILYMHLGSGAGLALQKARVNGQESNTYRRIGLVVSSADADWKEEMSVRELHIV